MRTLTAICSLALLVPVALSQQGEESQPDRLTLANGDVLTGTVTAMADGSVMFSSPSLGDIAIPMSNIRDLQTTGAVELLTVDGERVKRRITGIAGGALQLAGGAEGAPAAPSLAIDQLDQINPPEPAVKWTGSINVGAMLSNGNTDRRSANAAAELIRRSDIDRFTVDATWNYSEEKNGPAAPQPYTWNLTQRRTEGGLKYDYFLSDKSYLYVNTRAMGDTLADLELRYTVGGGYGYQWVEEADLSFSTEVGAGYFYENYRTTGLASSDYLTARGAYNLRWEITDGLRFLQKVEAYPSTEDIEDVYLTKDSRLQFDMAAGMFTQLQWVLDYDNTPSPGLERVDNRFILSVGWTF